MFHRVLDRNSLSRDQNFLLFWGSETASLLGSELARLVYPLIAILTFGATAFQVSLIQAFMYAPIIMFSLVVGVWFDRRRHRRHALLITNTVRALVIALVPLAYAESLLSLPLLYAVIFVVGCLTLMFEVGSLSYIPTLVERRHLTSANSRIQISFSLAAIAGPSLGGVLVAVMKGPVALAVSAVGFALSSVLLGMIRKAEPTAPTEGRREPILDSIKEGLRTVFSEPMLRNLLAQSATYNFFQNALIVVFVVYVVRTLGFSPQQLGFVLGFGAAAALLAAAVTNQITRRMGLGRTLRIATFGCCLPALLMLVPRNASLVSVVVLIIAQAISSFNLVVWNVNTLTLRQVVTPNGVLGRMNASYRMILYGTAPFGALAGGLLGETLGLRWAMVTTASLLLIPIGWTFISPVFRLSQMPDGPEETALDQAAVANAAAQQQPQAATD